MSNDVRYKNQGLAQEYKEKLVGKKFKHFKGGIYVVSNVAVDSETAQVTVIYNNAENPDLVWSRPVEMFTSDVDKVKYPSIKQKLRFEEIKE